MKYIESLREGERINEIYLCKTKQSALTKAGKPYENVILQDKTGILDAKSGIRVLLESMILIRWITLLLWEISQVFRGFTALHQACQKSAGRGV